MITKITTFTMSVILVFVLSFCSFTTEQSYTLQEETTPTDTAYDVHFYRINVEVDVNRPYIKGNTECRFNVQMPTNTIQLNFTNELTIDKIEGSVPLQFSHKQDIIQINFKKTIQPNQKPWVRIFYSGEAVTKSDSRVTKGLVYEKHGDAPLITTLNTPFLSHLWFPCKDDISDKADSVFVDITIPDTTINNQPLMGISNGKLAYEVKRRGNKKTFKWRHRYPIAPCYVFMVISNFKKIESHFRDKKGEGYPLEYYVFEEDYNASKKNIDKIPEVLAFFSERFGDYPFAKEKFGLIQIGFYSGIETQTSPIVNNFKNERWMTIIHEIAHAWFGNSVSCENWQHVWLHEGFASYAEALWIEYDKGKRAYNRLMKQYEYYQGGNLYGEATQNPFQVYKGITYSKGAYVLHILRGILGNEVFFKSLKTFANAPEYKYKNATIEDFQKVCETVSGKELGYFFKEWVYGEAFPTYNYSFYEDAREKTVTLDLYQTQQRGVPSFFTMPIQFKAELKYKDTIFTVWNNKPEQTWYLNFTQPVKNIVLDPNQWILKEISSVKYVKLESHWGLTDVKIDGNLSGRNIDITMMSPKSQKVTILLKQYGEVMYKKKVTAVGTMKTTIEVPRNLEGGEYILEIDNKYETFIRKWMVKH